MVSNQNVAQKFRFYTKSKLWSKSNFFDSETKCATIWQPRDAAVPITSGLEYYMVVKVVTNIVVGSTVCTFMVTFYSIIQKRTTAAIWCWILIKV